jgi:hypothetical protein
LYKIINLRALISKYLRTEVTWDVAPDYEFPYVAKVGNDEWKIQTNAFPEEEAYSLYTNGRLVLEFSRWPEKYWGREPDERWQELMDKHGN